MNLKLGVLSVSLLVTSAVWSGEWSACRDEKPLKVEAARCSAMPVNIRWPGHQRFLDQTEVCGFVRFDFAGETVLALTPPRAFTNVVVRPASRGARIVRDGDGIRLTLVRPGAYSVEIDGRHENLHVFADRPRDFGVVRESANVRFFGPGEHDVGVIELKSGQTLFIDEGAVVYGRIVARDADRIRILGKGILDGSRVRAEPRPLDPAKAAEQRAKGWAVTNVKRFDAIRLEFCDDVEIRGITIRDAPLYTIRPVCCDRLNIEGVKVVGNWRYNSDGIDMHNCRGVVIRDCFLRTFDDSICVKGFDYVLPEAEMLHEGVLHDTFENVLVEGCTIWTDWGRSLEIGAETRGRAIRNIRFRDCDVIYRVGFAMDVQNCDQAEVSDIAFEDIRVEDDGGIPQCLLNERASAFASARRGIAPPLLAVVIHYIPEYSKAGAEHRGRVHDVVFRNISVSGPRLPGGLLQGFDADHRVERVGFESVSFNGMDVTDDFTRSIEVRPFADPPSRLLTERERGAMNRPEGYSAVSGSANGVRVLVLGNSTALHGPNPAIGWTNRWGMAASAAEKDYAHLVARGIEARMGRSVELRVRNVYGFECDYRSWDVVKNLRDEIDFRSDYLVWGAGGNAKNLDKADNAASFGAALDRLLGAFFTDGRKPVLVVVGGFWPNAPLDSALRTVAKRRSAPFVKSDFAGQPGMYAKGLFWHKGVEGHPGDRGMAERARRILEALFPAGASPTEAEPNGGRPPLFVE